MKQFDLNRFGRILKYHSFVIVPTWLRIMGIYVLVLFLAELFITRLQGMNYEVALENNPIELVYNLYATQVRQTALFGLFFLAIALLFGATNLFSHLKSKAQRSTYLTLPASNLEKYIASFLHAIVLLAIGTFVAYCVADALRMMLDLISGRLIIWGVPYFFDSFHLYDAPWQLVPWIIGILLYLHSIYILGGTLFRKLNFVLTSILVIIGFFLVMWGVSATREWIDWYHFPKSRSADGEPCFHWLFYVFMVLTYLLTAVHYWLSYKIFCRMQVINNKWLNV